MQARWMDNGTGRFISSDPVKDGYNWYSYTAGNPISYVDPTGLLVTTKKKPGTLGFSSGGGEYAYPDVGNSGLSGGQNRTPSVQQAAVKQATPSGGLPKPKTTGKPVGSAVAGAVGGGGCPRGRHSGPCVDDYSNDVEFPYRSKSSPVYAGQAAFNQGKAKADTKSRDAQVNVQDFVSHDQANELNLNVKAGDIYGSSTQLMGNDPSLRGMPWNGYEKFDTQPGPKDNKEKTRLEKAKDVALGVGEEIVKDYMVSLTFIAFGPAGVFALQLLALNNVILKSRQHQGGFFGYANDGIYNYLDDWKTNQDRMVGKTVYRGSQLFLGGAVGAGQAGFNPQNFSANLGNSSTLSFSMASVNVSAGTISTSIYSSLAMFMDFDDSEWMNFMDEFGDGNKDDEALPDMPDEEVINKEWHQGTRDSSKKSFLDHFNKHGDEVGAETPNEYLQFAKKYKRMRNSLKSRPSNGPTPDSTYYYDPDYYVEIAPDGRILSFGDRL